MNIRPYKNEDKENFRNICLITAGETVPTGDTADFITAFYCDYYIKNEPNNCIALTDSNDNAVGYIICSENFSFYKNHIGSTLKHIASTGFSNYIFALGEVIGHGLFSKNYSAHFHIDILPEYQHCGCGTMLMDTLKDNLKKKGVDALHLMVNANNKNAVAFYKKNGFSVHSDFKKFYVMTCRF